MDLEKRARRANYRVIISETLMVVTVAIMVVILAFIVSGYWLNADFTVERQGMLQISSVPTGASVEVDGDAPWFQRTNTSKVLSSGEHTVRLTKDGYDSWSKTINIREGLLYRLHYPRLFLKEREKESVQSFPTATFATVSPDRKWLLLADNTTTWTLVNLDRDHPDSTSISITALLRTGTDATNTSVDAEPAETAVFTGEVISADWSSDNEHVLFAIRNGTAAEWLLINVRNPLNSFNLTLRFSTNFDKVRIFNNSASRLIATYHNRLYLLDITQAKLPTPIVNEVIDFDFYESEIIFAARTAGLTTEISAYTNDSTPVEAAEESVPEIADNAAATLEPPAENGITRPYYIASVQSADAEPTVLEFYDESPRVFISRFYETQYITVATGDVITVYEKDNFAEFLSKELSFIPETIKVGHAGEFFFMASGPNLATLDMESLDLTEWSADTVHYGWLDGDMLYAVKDGALAVYDFDGQNRRNLATNVSERFPVTITSDKWLYYFSDGTLTREWLIQR